MPIESHTKSIFTVNAKKLFLAKYVQALSIRFRYIRPCEACKYSIYTLPTQLLSCNGSHIYSLSISITHSIPAGSKLPPMQNPYILDGIAFHPHTHYHVISYPLNIVYSLHMHMPRMEWVDEMPWKFPNKPERTSDWTVIKWFNILRLADEDCLVVEWIVQIAQSASVSLYIRARSFNVNQYLLIFWRSCRFLLNELARAQWLVRYHICNGSHKYSQYTHSSFSHPVDMVIVFGRIWTENNIKYI